MTRLSKHTRHPVESLLRESISHGQKPDVADVDALKLPAADRRRFDAAVDEALALWDDGDRRGANATAHEASADIIYDLPEHLQDPNYGHTDPFDGASIEEIVAATPRSPTLNIPARYADAEANR